MAQRSCKDISPVKQPRHGHRHSLRLALEPRFVFDAAAVTTAEVIADHADPAPAAAPAADAADHHAVSAQEDGISVPNAAAQAAPAPSDVKELIFVDPRVQDWQTLTASAPVTAQVVVLDPGSDGLSQIGAALAGRHGIEAIHVLSHGADGQLSLGAEPVTSAVLLSRASDVAGWGDALTKDADILLYGCDVAETDQGRAFLSLLGDLTGADVAASSGGTGAAAAGGDWLLEAASGQIDAHAAQDAFTAAGYHGLLSAAPHFTDTATLARSTNEDTALTVTGITLADADSSSLSVTISAQYGDSSAAGGTITLASTANLAVSGNGSGTVTLSGTAADINAALNGMTYQAAGGANGNISLHFTGTDGVNGATPLAAAIAVIPVNDAPVLTPPVLTAGQLHVAEGGSATFSASTFGLIDPDISTDPHWASSQVAAQIIVKIAELPLEGRLTLNGNPLVVGSTFAMSQIGSLSYVHTGGQVLSQHADSFKVTVDDGAGGTVAATAISVVLTPVNQAPEITGTTVMFEGETGKAVSITIADGDQAIGTPHTVTILSLPNPADGVLNYDGTAVTLNQVIAAFDAAKLTFDHSGSDANFGYPPDVTLQIRVSDDGGGQGVPLSADATLTLKVTPVNDDPLLVTNTGLTVTGGGTVTITGANLTVADADSPTSTLTYRITQGVDANLGRLELHSGGAWTALGAGAVFTQADIDAGRVRYAFNSGNTAAEADSFKFTVVDGGITRLGPDFSQTREGGIYGSSNAAAALTEFTFAITVQTGTASAGGGNSPAVAGNLPPSQAANTGIGYLELDEGATAAITQTMLNVTDADSAADHLTYRITSLPEGGAVQVLQGDGSWAAVPLYGSFTQQQINDGEVRFAHDGGETFDDAFTFTVSDGTTILGAQNFTIKGQPVNDAPTAAVSNEAYLLEGYSFTFNSGTPGFALAASAQVDITLDDVDGSGDQVWNSGDPGWDPNHYSQPDTTAETAFKVTVPPGHGTLEYSTDGSVWTAISAANMATVKVTRAMLDNGWFRYQHDSSENFADSFQITPIDRFDQTGAAQTVDLVIASLNDDPAASENKGLTVTEGGTGTIMGSNGSGGDLPRIVYTDTDNTTVQRQYLITTNVQYGTLMLNGNALGVGSSFTQDDLDNNRITYRHNASEQHLDGFAFDVRDGGGASVPGTYVITIDPANQKPTITATDSSIPFGTGTPIAFDSPSGNRIVIADKDVTVLDPGEQDVIRVTVDPQVSGSTYGGGTLTLGTVAGIAFMEGTANGEAKIVIEGDRASVQAALDSMTYQIAGDADAAIAMKVTVDDRIRDGGGTVIGANGGTQNQNGTPLGDAGNTASVTITLYASNVADAPTLQVPVTPRLAAEDTAFVFTGAGNTIQITDPDAFPIAEAVGSVVLSANHGTLSLGNANGATATPSNGGQTLTLTGTGAQVNAALLTLRYTGTADFVGSDSLTVTVKASTTGTGLGLGGLADVTETVAIDIQPRNDLPTMTGGPGGAITAGSSNPAVFSTGNGNAFILGDADLTPPSGGLGGTDLLRLHIDPTPGWTAADYGSVTLGSTSGITVISGVNGGVITQSADGAGGPLVIEGTLADLQAALNGLSYQPPGNADHVVQLTLTLDDLTRDGTGAVTGANGGTPNQDGSTPAVIANSVTRVVVINASSSDDPAVISAPATVTAQEDAYVTIGGANWIADPDQFGGIMEMTVSVGGGMLRFTGLNGATVTAGSNDQASITLSGTQTQLNAALATLQYRSGTADFNGTAQDSLTITVDDKGNTGDIPLPGSLPSGVTIGGGGTSLVTTRVMAIDIAAVNDAPTATQPTVTLPAADEDSANPGGATVSALFGPAYADARDQVTGGSSADALAGIAITANAATASQGIWQYSTDGTTWTGIGTPSDGSALVVAATASLRFLPVADFNGTPGGLTVRLIDASSGPAATGATADVSGANSGGITPYSDAANAVALTTAVTAVNDAPVATGSVTLPAENEDSANPGGATVSALFAGSFSDSRDQVAGGSSANSLAGVAITANAATASQGIWQYSTDGTTWTGIGTPSDGSALVVAATASLRFLPAADFNGAPGGLTVRLIDSSTSATTGATVDVSGANNGGTTAYSAATVPLVTSITAINDAPAATQPTVALPAVDQDSANPPGGSVADLFGPVYDDGRDQVAGGSSADVPAGIAITGNSANPSTQGRWQYSTDGATWTDIPTTVSPGTALVVAQTGSLRFLPAAGFSGNPPGLTVRLIDASSGPVTSGATVDVSGANSGAAAAVSGPGNEVTLNTGITAHESYVPTEPGPTGEPPLLPSAPSPTVPPAPGGGPHLVTPTGPADPVLITVTREDREIASRLTDESNPNHYLRNTLFHHHLAGIPELFLVGSVGNQLMIPLQTTTFQVPPNIFRHTNPMESLTYEVARPDGSPLPNWLRFNSRDLSFRGTPPATARGAVDVVIVAKDIRGNKASAPFRILVTQDLKTLTPNADTHRQNGPAKAPAAKAPAVPAEPQPAPQPERHSAVDGAELDGAVPSVMTGDAPQTDQDGGGRTSFTAQLGAAGLAGRIAQSRAILDSLEPAA